MPVESRWTLAGSVGREKVVPLGAGSPGSASPMLTAIIGPVWAAGGGLG